MKFRPLSFLLVLYVAISNKHLIVCKYVNLCNKSIIQRILHGRVEIRNFSSSVEEYFTNERSERVKYYIFQHEKRNFVSPSGHVVFFLIYKHQLDTKPIHINIYFFCFCHKRCDLSCSWLCSHSNGDLFTCEDIMFSRESSPGISLVFI